MSKKLNYIYCLNRIHKVLNSCLNENQLITAKYYCRRLLRQNAEKDIYNEYLDKWTELERFIKLFNIKEEANG